MSPQGFPARGKGECRSSLGGGRGEEMAAAAKTAGE